MCAERTALFSTIAQDTGRPTTLLLFAERTNGRLTFPCGACLQVALELGGPELQVIACDLDGKNESTRLGDLAPRLPYKGKQRA
jgi:cytidine deaminase